MQRDSMKQLPPPSNRDAHAVSLHDSVGRPAFVGYVPQPPEPAAPASSDLGLLLDYLGILRRHKTAVGIATGIGCMAALAFSLAQTPMYRGQTALEIQGVQEPFSTIISNADPQLQTYAQLLQTKTLRERVVSKLTSQRPQVSENKDPFHTWRRFLRLSNKPVTWEEALDRAELSVIPTPESRILKIQCDSPLPLASAEFANRIAREYIEQSLEQRWESYQNTNEWLTRAQEQLRLKLEKAEKDLLDFARATGLLFTGETENVAEIKLKQLQTELSTAQADRIAKEAVYDSSKSSGHADSLPEVLDNGPMGSYQVKLAELRSQLAELSATYTPEYSKVKKLQAQIEALEGAQGKERGNILKRIRIEYQSAQRRERELAGQYASQSKLVTEQAEKLIRYKMLKREVDTNRQLYETTLQQGKQVSIASAMRASNARIVDPAEPARLPVKPNLILNLALGTMGGLSFGALFVIARERADTSIQAPGSLPLYLNVRELGVIPSASADPEVRVFGRREPTALMRDTGDAESDTTERDRLSECLELVTWTRGPSIIAEAYRATMTSILFSSQSGNAPQVIVVSSPSPAEGKTTAVSNLGIALAEINQRVLLIDADMRIPRLHTIFDLSNSWGLAELLNERNPIDAYPADRLVRNTEIPGLFVLPSGPARVSAARLLYSARMAELIRRFRRDYETILIDTAPVLSVPDSRILARLADAVILVFRSGHATRDAAGAAMRCFEEDGSPVLGTILNDWNPAANTGAYYGKKYTPYYRTTRGPQAAS